MQFRLDSLGECLPISVSRLDLLGVQPMAKEKADLVYGTLDMLILKALQNELRHGLAIADRIHQMSEDILRVEQGSLYPALYRLEAEGWISAEAGISESNRKARFYRLTPAGRKQLSVEAQHWARMTAAVDLVLSKT